MNVRTYLFLVPFICFLAGYATVRFFIPSDELYTPSLVGKSLGQAMRIISAASLNTRILTEKLEPHLPEGTIIFQKPLAGHRIKPHQSVFLALSKKPDPVLVPTVIHMPIANAQKDLDEKGIKYKLVPIQSPFPKDTCIGQFPAPQEPLQQSRMIVYVAAEEKKPIIWPPFIGQSLEDALEQLSLRGLEPKLIYQKNTSTHLEAGEYKVIDQRPLPGSIILLDTAQPPAIQLKIAEKQ